MLNFLSRPKSNSIWCVSKRNRASFNSKELGLDIFNHKYVVIKVFFFVDVGRLLF